MIDIKVDDEVYINDKRALVKGYSQAGNLFEGILRLDLVLLNESKDENMD